MKPERKAALRLVDLLEQDPDFFLVNLDTEPLERDIAQGLPGTARNFEDARDRRSYLYVSTNGCQFLLTPRPYVQEVGAHAEGLSELFRVRLRDADGKDEVCTLFPGDIAVAEYLLNGPYEVKLILKERLVI